MKKHRGSDVKLEVNGGPEEEVPLTVTNNVRLTSGKKWSAYP